MNRIVGIAAALAIGAGILIAGFMPSAPSERIRRPMSERIEKSDAEWRAALTPEQYQVTRRKGTERAFTGEYHDCKKDGIFVCICCGQPLFDTTTKFESGTGWPSFFQPAAKENVDLVADNSLFARRTEVICSRCDAHLGHVFNDGPNPTGLRYCINSALKLTERGPE